MTNSADSASFLARANHLLATIDAAFDTLSREHDVDVDVETSGAVMTVTFESGHRIVVNVQEANEEVWLAAKSGGFHYRWNDDALAWGDTRGGVDLSTRLMEIVEAETGARLALRDDQVPKVRSRGS